MGVCVVVPKLIFELVLLLGLVFKLPELVYLAVLKIELAFKPVFQPLGLVSLLINHLLELFELAHFVTVIVYELVVLIYPALVTLELLRFVLECPILICLISALGLELSVLMCPSDLLVRLFSSLVFRSLVTRCIRLVIVVVELRWVLIGLVVVRVRVVLVLVVAIAVVTVIIIIFVHVNVVVQVLVVIGHVWVDLTVVGVRE